MRYRGMGLGMGLDTRGRRTGVKRREAVMNENMQGRKGKGRT
jgi:hypothetical protein